VCGGEDLWGVLVCRVKGGGEEGEGPKERLKINVMHENSNRVGAAFT
jgi:hypothetical protein